MCIYFHIFKYCNIHIVDSDKEKEHWITKVDPYVRSIENQAMRQGMSLYGHHLHIDKVSHLHTGSIPSQFGKPLMTLSELPVSVLR